jgi:hypothetical protein
LIAAAMLAVLHKSLNSREHGADAESGCKKILAKDGNSQRKVGTQKQADGKILIFFPPGSNTGEAKEAAGEKDRKKKVEEGTGRSSTVVIL